MATVEMQDDGTFRAECERCGWHEDHKASQAAIDAASFHGYGFARRGGLFGQENRRDLLCPIRRAKAA